MDILNLGIAIFFAILLGFIIGYLITSANIKKRYELKFTNWIKTYKLNASKAEYMYSVDPYKLNLDLPGCVTIYRKIGDETEEVVAEYLGRSSMIHRPDWVKTADKVLGDFEVPHIITPHAPRVIIAANPQAAINAGIPLSKVIESVKLNAEARERLDKEDDVIKPKRKRTKVPRPLVITLPTELAEEFKALTSEQQQQFLEEYRKLKQNDFTEVQVN